ncbi:hypothetical protein BDW02DRAFT_628177 [Decorospora gaudefroyi]|uniref:AIG1-type G domain-containing protein n=1 Tax=Decorospora gaudefroyi TaxID=184978 RepID=A0A6A5KS52_9PLEO|nr:hypothetical protein BDW02DRAFT_628177 [Decorospora gaudefroyi]
MTAQAPTVTKTHKSSDTPLENLPVALVQPQSPEVPQDLDDTLDDDLGLDSECDDPTEDGKEKESRWKGVPYASFNWTYQKLARLVRDSKGKASTVVVKFVKKHLGGTKLIFVVGKSGKGKTSLLRELTGLDLHVGSTLKAGTMSYQVCPAVIRNEQYLFIDTPGFGACIEDDDNHREIWSCLAALGPIVTFAGVLFVWGPPDTRMTFEDQKTIRWVQTFCGPKLFKQITVITTMWDKLSEEGVEEDWKLIEELMRSVDMERLLNPPGSHHGGQFYHHGFPKGEGGPTTFSKIISKRKNPEQRAIEIQDMIHRRYSEVNDCKPQIMMEVKRGTDLMATEAANVLAIPPVKTQIAIYGDRAVVELFPESQRVTEPEHCPRPQPRATPKPEKSWSESFFEWFDVAKRVAVHFRDLKAHQSNPSSKQGKPALGGLWDRLKGWWSGEEPPKD